MQPSTSGVLPPGTRRERLLVLLIGCALTATLTYPTIPLFATAGRIDGADGRFSIWNVAWIAHSLLDDPRHLFDANIFHPHRHTLAYSELNLVAGVLATPVYAFTRNPFAAHNSAVLIALFVTFLAMWALVHRLTSSTGAGLVAATAYTFSAFTASHTAEIQLLMLFGFPLVMLAFHLLHERPTILAGVWLGATLALTALGCGYYGVFAAGTITAASLLWASWRRDYWIALATAVFAALVLVLPVLASYLYFRAGENVHRIVRLQDLAMFSASWSSYLATGTELGAVWTTPLLRYAPTREVMFPGITVLGLAAIAVFTAWRDRLTRRLVAGYIAIAVLALWASFGPAAGLYVAVAKATPGGMSFLRVPARLGVLVTFALSVLAGVGVRSLESRRRWLAPALLVFLVVELRAPWPLQRMPPVPRAYRMLAVLPHGAVVEFPFPYHSTDLYQHTTAMMYSMWNWQPLVNGYSDHIPKEIYEIAVPINGFPDAESFEILRERDVHYVVLRIGDYAPPYQVPLLAKYGAFGQNLRLLTDANNVRLYEIVSWPTLLPRDTDDVRKHHHGHRRDPAGSS